MGNTSIWCNMQIRLQALLAIMLIVPAAAFGQALDQLDEGSPQVEAFARAMSNLESFSADIEYAIQSPSLTTETGLKGKLLAKGEAYKITTPGLELYSDGKVRWQYLPEQNEVTIAALEPVEATPLDHPLQLFKHYAEYFKVRYRGQRTEGGKTFLDYSFYPRNLRQPYSQIHLTVQAGVYIPYKITYQGKDGTNYLITMSNFKKNAPIAEALAFNSAAHPGVEIVDLR